jgi:hypothetical protein
MQGAKESRSVLMKLSNAHSRVGRRRASQSKTVSSRTIEKEKHCHTAHVAHKQASLYGMRYP